MNHKVTKAQSFFNLSHLERKDFLLFLPDSILSLASTPEPNEKFAEIAKFGNRYAIVSGAIGTLINFLSLLFNLDDPAKIGSGMAISLLPFLYALIIAEVYFAYLHRTYLKGNNYKGIKPLDFNAMFVATFVIFSVLFIFFMLFVPF